MLLDKPCSQTRISLQNHPSPSSPPFFLCRVWAPHKTSTYPTKLFSHGFGRRTAAARCWARRGDAAAGELWVLPANLVMPLLAGFEQAPKAVQAMWCYARDINEWHEQAGAAVEAYNNAMAAGALGLPERVRVSARARAWAPPGPNLARGGQAGRAEHLCAARRPRHHARPRPDAPSCRLCV